MSRRNWRRRCTALPSGPSTSACLWRRRSGLLDARDGGLLVFAAALPPSASDRTPNNGPEDDDGDDDDGDDSVASLVPAWLRLHWGANRRIPLLFRATVL